MERIQRLSDYFRLQITSSKAQTILILMYMLELSDILFFIKSTKQPSDNFNISHTMLLLAIVMIILIWRQNSLETIKLQYVYYY